MRVSILLTLAFLCVASGQTCAPVVVVPPANDPFVPPLIIPDAGCSIDRPFNGGNGCCYTFFQPFGAYLPCPEALDGDWIIEFDQNILSDCLSIHDGFLVAYFDGCVLEQFFLPVPINTFSDGSASFSFFSNIGLSVFFDLQYADGVWFLVLDWGGALYTGVMFQS